MKKIVKENKEYLKVHKSNSQNRDTINDLNKNLSKLTVSENQNSKPAPSTEKTTLPIQSPVEILASIADIISKPSNHIKPSSKEQSKLNPPLQAKGWTAEKLHRSIDEEVKNITEHKNMIKCYDTIISYMKGTINQDQLMRARNDSCKDAVAVFDTLIAGLANITKNPPSLRLDVQNKLQLSIEQAKIISNFAIKLSVKNLRELEQYLQQNPDNNDDKSSNCSQFGSDEETNLNNAGSAISNTSSTIQDLNIDYNLDLTGNSSDI